MLTNKNWAPMSIPMATAISTIRRVFAVCAVILLVGCQPPGPKSLLLGEKYLEQGDYNKALKYLTRASDLMKEHPQVWNHLGLAYHGLQQPAKAVEAYQRAIRIDRNLPAPHYNLGVLLLEQQHLPQAVAELHAFVTLQTNSPAGWTKLGTALVRMKRPDEAERALIQALRLDPKDSEAHNSLGLTHIQRKRPREAMLSFNNALQYSPGYAPAVLNQAVIAQQHFGNKPLALERYRAYLSTKPDAKIAAQVQQVISALEQEINGVDVAETTADETETNPFSASLRTNLAAARKAEGPTNQTAAHTATNLAVRPAVVKTNIAPSTNVTVAAAPATNIAPRVTATNVVARAVTNAPVTVTTNKALAAAETEPELPPLTVEVLSVDPEPEFKPVADLSETKSAPAPVAAVTNEPFESKPLLITRRDRKQEEKPGLLSRVNPVRWFRDDDKEATRDAEVPAARQEAAPPARPSYPPVVKTTNPQPEPPRVIPRYQYRKHTPLKAGNRAAAQKLFQRGADAHQRRRLAEAMEAYQNATLLDPSFYDAHYNLGLAAYQSKNLPLALSANELALAAKPSSPDARYNFALTLREANYPADAANELRTLLVDHPDEARAHFALANLYAQQLDQPALARRHYLAVLELQPSHPEAGSIRHWLGNNQ